MAQKIPTTTPSGLRKVARTSKAESNTLMTVKAKAAVDSGAISSTNRNPRSALWVVKHAKALVNVPVSTDVENHKPGSQMSSFPQLNPDTVNFHATTSANILPQMTVEISVQIILLTGASTYPAWREQMSHILRSQNLWNLVACDRTEPTDVDQRIQFLKDSTRLSGLLLRTVEPEIQRAIALAVRVDGKRLWQTLEGMFASEREGQQGEVGEVPTRTEQKNEDRVKRKRGAEPLRVTSAKRAKKESAVETKAKQPIKKKLPEGGNPRRPNKKTEKAVEKVLHNDAGPDKKRKAHAELFLEAKRTKKESGWEAKKGSGREAKKKIKGYLRPTLASATKGRK
jgi:hypothetical protein